MTEEEMMVPMKEFERLANYYKGQISESAPLNKAGQLAAEQHLTLKNPTIHDATAVKMVKPMAREQARLTKCCRCCCPTTRRGRDGGSGGRSLGKHVEKNHQMNNSQMKSNTGHADHPWNCTNEKEMSLATDSDHPKKTPPSKLPILKKSATPSSKGKGKGKSGWGLAVKKGVKKALVGSL